TVDSGTTNATLVSTGVLPIRVSAEGADPVDLVSGERGILGGGAGGALRDAPPPARRAGALRAGWRGDQLAKVQVSGSEADRPW
ncbi:hypothetical protein C5C53_15010, partial [Rathayibacter sp. AY1E3]